MCEYLLMPTASTAAQTFPSDITKLGRGRAQRAILDYLHRTRTGTGAVAVTDMAAHPAFRRMHLCAVLSAVDALAKRGIIRKSSDDIGTPSIALNPHTHA